MHPKLFFCASCLLVQLLQAWYWFAAPGLVHVHKGNACIAAYQCQGCVFAGIAGDQLS